MEPVPTPTSRGTVSLNSWQPRQLYQCNKSHIASRVPTTPRKKNARPSSQPQRSELVVAGTSNSTPSLEGSKNSTSVIVTQDQGTVIWNQKDVVKQSAGNPAVTQDLVTSNAGTVINGPETTSTVLDCAAGQSGGHLAGTQGVATFRGKSVNNVTPHDQRRHRRHRRGIGAKTPIIIKDTPSVLTGNLATAWENEVIKNLIDDASVLQCGHSLNVLRIIYLIDRHIHDQYGITLEICPGIEVGLSTTDILSLRYGTPFTPPLINALASMYAASQPGTRDCRFSTTADNQFQTQGLTRNMCARSLLGVVQHSIAVSAQRLSRARIISHFGRELQELPNIRTAPSVGLAKPNQTPLLSVDPAEPIQTFNSTLSAGLTKVIETSNPSLTTIAAEPVQMLNPSTSFSAAGLIIRGPVQKPKNVLVPSPQWSSSMLPNWYEQAQPNLAEFLNFDAVEDDSQSSAVPPITNAWQVWHNRLWNSQKRDPIDVKIFLLDAMEKKTSPQKGATLYRAYLSRHALEHWLQLTPEYCATQEKAENESRSLPLKSRSTVFREEILDEFTFTSLSDCSRGPRFVQPPPEVLRPLKEYESDRFSILSDRKQPSNFRIAQPDPLPYQTIRVVVLNCRSSSAKIVSPQTLQGCFATLWLAYFKETNTGPSSVVLIDECQMFIDHFLKHNFFVLCAYEARTSGRRNLCARSSHRGFRRVLVT